MRVSTSVVRHKRHKKILKRAKGFHGARKLRIKAAKEAVMHAMAYEYRDRKLRKRDFRSLWIVRINAFVRGEGMTYNRFIEGLRKANVTLNRKALANLAVENPDAMKELVALAKKHVG